MTNDNQPLQEPLLIPHSRWSGDLGYLREIPNHERSRWRISPPEMSWAAASVWARQIRADKIIRLSTGESLVRLREAAPMPWHLPPPPRPGGTGA